MDKYFKKASNQGNDEAMRLLGLMLVEVIGILMNKKKKKKAVEYFKR